MNVMTTTALYTHDDGIKIYSTLGLYVYDALIMGAVTRYVWDCPSEQFVEHYRAHAANNHADVGVGTGYCLDQCGFVPGETRLALLDLQPNCLRFAASRLARYSPEQYIWNAGEPLTGIRPFDSVGLGGVLHCLPGDMRQKGRVFDELNSICNPGATIFGYTLVNDPIGDQPRRRVVCRLFHRLQIVNFAHDSVRALQDELSQRFSHYSLNVTGCFAFFTATAEPNHRSI